MNGAKILAVVEKEITEARKNRMILISMALLPTLLVALVLGTAFFLLNSDGALDEDDLGIIPAKLS